MSAFCICEECEFCLGKKFFPSLDMPFLHQQKGSNAFFLNLSWICELQLIEYRRNNAVPVLDLSLNGPGSFYFAFLDP